MNTRSRGPAHSNGRPPPEPGSLLSSQPEPENVVQSSPTQQEIPSPQSAEPNCHDTEGPRRRHQQLNEDLAPTVPQGGIKPGIGVLKPDLVLRDSESPNLENSSPAEEAPDEQHPRQMEADVQGLPASEDSNQNLDPESDA